MLKWTLEKLNLFKKCGIEDEETKQQTTNLVFIVGTFIIVISLIISLL